MLNNFKNYGVYSTFIKKKEMIIDVNEITEQNWRYHFDCILNILRDGLENEEIQKNFFTIRFKEGDVKLSIFDYFINLIMWRGILELNSSISSRHLLYSQNTTRKEIKRYIDNNFIIPYRDKYSNRVLNNIICDTLDSFKYIDEFSLYLSNTINLEDDIMLMNSNEEAWNLYHTSLQDVSLEDVKRVGMQNTNRLIEIIKNDDRHCLSDYFRANEGINPKQYKEFAINIGTKPDGEGGIFPVVIDSSYIRGGLTNTASLFVESSAGRTAQILSKTNVGSSGYFARLLGLNNSDTILHRNPNYVCNSKNYQIINIINNKMFTLFIGRYYRLSPTGMEYIIRNTDTHLIGKTIYLRSPMTCASKSRGEGICYRCYGNLAYTNNDINAGKIAAELLSSVLTQMLLSAKHLLESLIQKFNWSGGFDKYLVMDTNLIYIDEDLDDIKNHKLIIDPNNIHYENEHDDFDYNEYVSEFKIDDGKGNQYPIYTSEADDMYISGELNDYIRKVAVPEDGDIVLPLEKIQGVPLFLVKIHNNELSRTLERIKSIINKKSVTQSFSRHELLQTFVETTLEGGLDINSVHYETIISNQLRSVDDILVDPSWSVKDVDCQILTLDHALKNNPSIVVTMSYENLNKTLYNPLTFKPSKNKPSFMDLFFMEAPQKYLNPNFEGDFKG